MHAQISSRGLARERIFVLPTPWIGREVAALLALAADALVLTDAAAQDLLAAGTKCSHICDPPHG